MQAAVWFRAVVVACLKTWMEAVFIAGQNELMERQARWFLRYAKCKVLAIASCAALAGIYSDALAHAEPSAVISRREVHAETKANRGMNSLSSRIFSGIFMRRHRPGVGFASCA